jgi:hypothetical protein
MTQELADLSIIEKGVNEESPGLLQIRAVVLELQSPVSKGGY